MEYIYGDLALSKRAEKLFKVVGYPHNSPGSGYILTNGIDTIEITQKEADKDYLFIQEELADRIIQDRVLLIREYSKPDKYIVLDRKGEYKDVTEDIEEATRFTKRESQQYDPPEFIGNDWQYFRLI